MSVVRKDFDDGLAMTGELGTGVADSTSFLRGDKTWQVAGSGGLGSVTDVTGTSPIFITGVSTVTPNVTIQGAFVSGDTTTTAQNLGALTTGLLKITVALGVATASTAVAGTDYESPLIFSTGLTRAVNTITADLSTGVAGGQEAIGGTVSGDYLRLRSNTSNDGKTYFGSGPNFYFDDNSRALIFGTSTPFSQAIIEAGRTVNTGAAFTVFNDSATANAYAAFFLAQSPTLATGATFGTFLFSSVSGFGAPYGASNGVFELAAGTGNMHFWIQQNTGDFVWYTKTTFPSSNDMMRLTNNGVFSVKDLGAAGTVRLVKAALTTGTLSLASASDVAGSIVWPSAGQVLVSTGTSTAPAGDANVLLDTTAHEFYITQSGVQSWYNATGANYERVRAFWSSNVWNLKSEKGAAGTLRAMKIDADTSALTLNGDTSVTITSSAGIVVGTGPTTAQVNIAASSTIVAQVAGGGTAHPTATWSTTALTLDTSQTIAFDASAIWDGLLVSGTALITGTGTVTSPVFACTNFQNPVISSASAVTVNNAATVFISGEPTTGGSTTISSAYAFWVGGGTSRFEGDLITLRDALLAGSGKNLGFFGSAGAAKQAPTGSRGGNAALASLLTALANYGLITDSTSA